MSATKLIRSYLPEKTLQSSILAFLKFHARIARMINRRALEKLLELLRWFPAVGLLGPRLVGKTTLAKEIAAGRRSIYLDLEDISDRDKLTNPNLYLSTHEDKLVVLDGVHLMPELFSALRGIIDRRREIGRRTGCFLILGSAAVDLLRQSSESLAGRIAYVELHPFDVLETDSAEREKLWSCGGFPESFLAENKTASMSWRENFVRTYLERDIPQMGPRIPAETLRRFWTMLAHSQGQLLNAARLADSLGVSGKTVARYLDLMVDLLLVRRLEPYHANVGKRLVKSPKIYIRDSGVAHALLKLDDMEKVLGHPVAGCSWEGFVIENILRIAPQNAVEGFYRTSGGAEIDLVLEAPELGLWAIEIKRSPVPRPTRGFHYSCEDLNPEKRFVVYPGDERYPITGDVEAVGLEDLCGELQSVTRAAG